MSQIKAPLADIATDRVAGAFLHRKDETSPLPFRLGYCKALDGIRGLAILSVLFVHSGFPWLPGGLHGVDLFFALSGFLITSILVEEYVGYSTISLYRFYARRSLRLFPALVFFLFCYCLYAIFVATRTRQHLEDAICVLGYATNWTKIYLDRPKMIAHTWSLAVEEHFYLIWPLLILLLLRTFRKTYQVATIVTGLVAIFILWRYVLWSAGASQPRLYLGSDTRGDFLLLGSAASLWCYTGITPKVSKFRTIIGVLLVASLLLFGCFLLWSGEVSDPSTYITRATLSSGLCTALVILARLSPPGAGLIFLENAILRWFGKISYSLYLWHMPIMLVLLMRTNRWEWALFLGAPVSILLAWISFRFVEQPCLRFKRRFESVSSQAASRMNVLEKHAGGLISSNTSA